MSSSERPLSPSTSVIVPAYDEEQGLSVVLTQLFALVDSSYEVIVVDDGSRDGTAEVAARFPCRLLRHEQNRGKGEALRTGFRHARGDSVIWVDADGTYPVSWIPEMARALSTQHDLVYASRRFGRDSIPVFNRVGNRMFQLLTHVLYGFKPQDPCTGLCGVRRVHLEAMGIESKRFSVECEVAIKAGRMGLRMLDLPITYGRRIGRQKLHGITAGSEILMTIVRHLFWKPGRAAAIGSLIERRG